MKLFPAMCVYIPLYEYTIIHLFFPSGVSSWVLLQTKLLGTLLYMFLILLDVCFCFSCVILKSGIAESGEMYIVNPWTKWGLGANPPKHTHIWKSLCNLTPPKLNYLNLYGLLLTIIILTDNINSLLTYILCGICIMYRILTIK